MQEGVGVRGATREGRGLRNLKSSRGGREVTQNGEGHLAKRQVAHEALLPPWCCALPPAWLVSGWSSGQAPS